MGQKSPFLGHAKVHLRDAAILKKRASPGFAAPTPLKA
jgi:hypothetical protein